MKAILLVILIAAVSCTKTINKPVNLPEFVHKTTDTCITLKEYVDNKKTDTSRYLQDIKR